MFCPNCGTKNENNAFCVKCGTNLSEINKGTVQNSSASPSPIRHQLDTNKKKEIAFWIAVLMSPFILIIRMLSLSRVAVNMRTYTEYMGVPDAIKVVGFVILFVGITISLVFNNQKGVPSSSKKNWTNILGIFDVVIGFVILLVRSTR